MGQVTCQSGRSPPLRFKTSFLPESENHVTEPREDRPSTPEGRRAQWNNSRQFSLTITLLPPTVTESSRPQLLFSILLIVAAIRPYPRAALGSTIFERVSDLILLALVVIVTVYVLHRNDWKVKLGRDSAKIFLLYGLLAGLVSVSLFSSPVWRPGDTFEVFRIVLYASLFFLGVLVRWRPGQIVTYVMTPLMVIMALQIPLAIGQYFRVDSVLFVLQWYTSERHLGSTRSVGMFFNPYIFSMFLIFPVVYLTRVSLSKPNLKTRIASATFIVLLLASILLSQSRSVLIVLIGTTVYMGMVLSVTSKTLFKRYVVVSGVAIAASTISAVMFLDLPYLASGFQSILTGGISNVSTAEMRFEKYGYLLSLFVERPVIGWGPAKSLSPNIENNYLLYLFRYGVLGLTVFLLLFSSFVLKTFRVYWHSEQRISDHSSPFYFAIHVWLVALLAGSLSNDFIANPRIFPFLFLFLGTVYSIPMLDR